LVSRLDLSKIPPPEIVTELSFERNLERIVEKLKATFEGWKAAQSDPFYKTAEVVSSEVFQLQGRINESIRQCMIAFARGSNLDQLGAIFKLLRAVVEILPDGTVIYEDDESFRAAIITAFDQYSTAGTRNGYLYWLRRTSTEIDSGIRAEAKKLREEGKASEAEALEKGILNAIDFNVFPTASDEDPEKDKLIMRDGRISGIAFFLNQTELGDLSKRVELIRDRMIQGDHVPLNDRLEVLPAEVIQKNIIAKLYVPNGPDPKVFEELAQSGARRFLAENTKIGKRISLSGLYSKLHVDGIIRVELLEKTEGGEVLITSDFVPRRNQVFKIDLEIRKDDSEKFTAA
jgi:phage-related baseplate assembly protein